MNRHVLAAALFVSGPALAQEFTGFMGPQHDLSTSAKTTYQWRLDYQQGLGKLWYIEGGWINDGHIPGHARDGITAQFGIRTTLGSPRWTIGIATGFDRYYDTINSTDSLGFADLQGFLWLTSAQLSYYLDRWIIRAQTNLEIAPSTTYNAWSLLLGVGYQLQAPDPGTVGARDLPAFQPERTTNNELTLYVGQTVPNGGKSDPKGVSGALEYRRGVARYLDVTVSYINQGDLAVLSRVGLAAQIWPVRAFGPTTLGLGLGGYFAVDQYVQPAPGQKQEHLAGLVSPTFSYRFGDHWLGRFLWNRTVTGNNTNTDFFSLGLGYRW
jgi:hypothetical protein